MDTTTLALVIGVFAVLGGIVLLTRRAAAARREALEAVARQYGWSFSPDRIEPASLDVGSFPLFARGRRGRAYNVSRGTPPVPVCVFDFSYTVQRGKHHSTITQTVVHAGTPGVSLPSFVLSPENVLHKVGGLFGYHDIDFDASPEFSAKYLLRSTDDEPRVRDLFHPSVRAWFEQRDPVTVESGAGGVIVYRERRTIRPDDLRVFVDDAMTVAAQFAA